MSTELVILIVSAGMLVAGLVLWQKGNNLLSNGRRTTATIFKNNYSNDDDTKLYYPVVRFQTEEKEWITQETSTGYYPAKEEGTEVEVIYHPKNPSNVEIYSVFQLDLLPKLLMLIGICGFLLGLAEILEISDLLD